MKLEPNFFNCINEWGANDAVVNTFGSALAVKQIGDRVLEISKDGELLGKVIEVRDNPGTFEIECGIGNITKAIGQVLKKCGGKIVEGNSGDNSNIEKNEEKVNEPKIDEKDKENKGNSKNGDTTESNIEAQPKVASKVNEAPSATLPSKPESTKAKPKIDSPKKAEKSVPTVTTRSSASDEFVIEEAERNQAWFRGGLSGPSGSGKTMSALRIAKGLCGPEGKWSDIVLIDTESHSGSLYANHTIKNKDGSTSKIGKYRIINLDAPYSPERYMRAIRAASTAGAKVIVIDSLSHGWVSEGGMLDIQAKAAAKSGNSYTAWKDVTPLHARLVDTMLSIPAHLIVTVRSKTEYVLEQNDRGKMQPKEVGMAPIFRDGLKYEFTTFLELSNRDNIASVGKDRTGIWGSNDYFTPDESTGEKILAWLQNSNE